MTKALKATIMLEAQQALAYLPAEDKINLAMSLVNAPDIDDKDTIAQMALEATEQLEQANATVEALKAKLAKAEGGDNT